MESEKESFLRVLATQEPSAIDTTCSHLLCLLPSIAPLLNQLPRSHTIDIDPETGKHYIRSPFNQVGSAHYSPFSALRRPPQSLLVRRMEIACNELLVLYASLYFGANTVTSAYFWHPSAAGRLCGVFLVHNRVGPSSFSEEAPAGTASLVESTHVLDFKPVEDGTEVTVFSSMTVTAEFSLTEAELGADQGRARFECQKEKVASRRLLDLFLPEASGADQQPCKVLKTFEEAAVKTAGELVEDNENCIRRSMEALHLAKCIQAAEIASDGRKADYVAHPIFATRDVGVTLK